MLTRQLGSTAARRLLALILLLIAVPLAAGGNQTGNALAGAKPGDLPEPRPETIVIRVYFTSTAQRDLLASELGAVEAATTGGYLSVWADRPTYESLLARGLRIEIDEALTRQANTADLSSNVPGTFYGGYKTVEEVEAFLDEKVAAHPTRAEKIDYGDSWCKTHPGICTQPLPYNGYDLWVLRITNQSIPGPKPLFWYNSGLHSREIASPEVAMRYIDWLLGGYNSNPDARWLVDHHEVWVAVLSNPDGHHIVESGGGGNAPYSHRKNADKDDGCTVWPPTSSSQFGVDLNRNFPFLWNYCSGCSSGSPCNLTYRGPSAESEEETQALTAKLRSLIPDQRGPNNSDPAPLIATGVFLDMHSYGAQNLYPWGWTGDPGVTAPNNNDLRNIARHMSAVNAGGNNYLACQAGPCLYPTDGASDDWTYGELGAPAFTTELGPTNAGFLPPYTTIEARWNENRGMLIYLAKIARTPYLTTRGPDANLVATDPMTVTQGAASRLTATINYNWTGNGYIQNVAAAEYYLDTPPWTGGTALPMTPVDGAFDSPTEAVEATIDTSSIPPGLHVLFVRARGVNDYEGHQSWGPISAAFLTVETGGGATATPAVTATSTTIAPTATQQATATSIPPTTTRTSTGTATTAPTQTPGGATATTVPPTACTVSFTDVPPGHTFYPFVRCLACQGIIGGYEDNTFRPGNGVTRGQLAKIVSNAAGWEEEPITWTFADVPPTNPFYPFVERMVRRGHIGGYPCGEPSEPCVPPGDMPYFRLYAGATRGQISKIVSNSAGFTDPPGERLFEDVPEGSTFYEWVQRLANRGIMGGYACGGPSEPCVPPANRPYFRPGNYATRGQVSKIVANTFFPGCDPQRR